MELAQAFLRLGAKVTLIARTTLLSKEDPALGAGLKALLEAEGMDVRTHTGIDAVRHDGARFHVVIGGETLQGDRLLLATGRRANTEGLDLGRIGLVTDASGAIAVGERLRTNIEHVFAAGDCTQLPQLYTSRPPPARAPQSTCSAARRRSIYPPCRRWSSPIRRSLPWA